MLYTEETLGGGSEPERRGEKRRRNGRLRHRGSAIWPLAGTTIIHNEHLRSYNLEFVFNPSVMNLPSSSLFVFLESTSRMFPHLWGSHADLE